MNLTAWISDYLEYCRYQKNLSADTLKAYRIDLAQFADYWAETDGSPTRVNLAPYIMRLQKRYQPRTARRKAASLKAFFGWLAYMEFLETDPFQKLRVKFNEPKILPRTIPLSLLSGLLSEAYRAVHAGERMALRDAAVLELLFATGMRVSELCSLVPQAVDLETGSVLIFGKGARERIIQVENADVRSALRAYYTAFEDQIAAAGRFLSTAGAWAVPTSLCGPCSANTCPGPGVKFTSRPICSAIPLQHSCWRRMWICGTSKPFWATAASPPRRSIPTLPPGNKRRSFRPNIRETGWRWSMDN